MEKSSNLFSFYRYPQPIFGLLPVALHVRVHVNVHEGPFCVSVGSARRFAASNRNSDSGTNHNGPDWITECVSRSHSLQSAECSSLGFAGSN